MDLAKVIRFKKLSDWDEVKDSCNTTIWKENDEKEITPKFKKRLLFSEHSPIRELIFSWKWEKLKYWISVHLVRHNKGTEHRVSSQREDRSLDKLDRNNKTQNSPVNHKTIANAQSIINISRKRLCYKAHPETKEAWEFFLEELKKTEPELVEVCVPECIYRGGICPEMQSCGYNKSLDFLVKFEKYIKEFKKQYSFSEVIFKKEDKSEIL